MLVDCLGDVFYSRAVIRSIYEMHCKVEEFSGVNVKRCELFDWLI